ncbi:MAG TPA: LysR family transcriptional regulator [Coleofasciculaceae cyanobacterium]|jgi:DNA-binding transcriptional LysR family regulator
MVIKGKSVTPKQPPWTWLDIRQLKYLVTLADEQSFSRAADRLGIMQPFLSKQVGLLEKKLGFQLFERKHRPLELTAAGQAFLKEARLILIQAEQAVESAYRASQGETGRLLLGINTSIANSKLPDILQTFQHHLPDVELVLHELASYDQIKLLQKQQLDVGFFHLHSLLNSAPEDHDLLNSMVVVQEPLVLVLPERHRFAKRTTLSVELLANENFVLPPSNLLYGLRDQIDQLCLEAGFKPKVKQEAAWISTVLSLVSGGVGVSLLPANVKNLQRTGVVYRSLEGNFPTLEIGAVWRKDNPSVVLQNFLKILQNLI